MKITKKLLERYELGQCTDQEQAAVRLWLDSDELDLEDTDKNSDSDYEEAIQQALWENITSYIDQPAPADRSPEQSSFARTPRSKSTAQIRQWIGIAAASVIVLGIGWWGYQRLQEPQYFNASNTDHKLLLWEEDSFKFTLSQNSSASINFQSGNMAVSGDVLFSPKRDFVLYDKLNNTSLAFRQGEVYYISTDPDTSELVVFSKTELEYLSPILQKHIRKQFHVI